MLSIEHILEEVAPSKLSLSKTFRDCTVEVFGIVYEYRFEVFGVTETLGGWL